MRPHLSLAAALTAALLLPACSDGSNDPGGDPTGTPEAGGFPATVGDLTLEERPTSIVSLSPAVTEMLFAIGAGDQVAAVDEFSNYPREAPTTDLSGFAVNAEAVANHDPDLVIISNNAEEVVPQFEAIGIPVHVAPDNPSTVDDVYAQITDLGTLTGRTDEAADVVRRMSDDLAKLVADSPERDEPLTYYFEIDETYWTYTSESIVGSLLSMVGLENIADEAGTVSVQLSVEAIFDADPDLIFLADTAYGVDAASVRTRDGWDSLTAVQSGRIVELDSDIASRWGPRIVDLMESVVGAVSRVP
jgi:iron complex transport system substrate-binding protein